MTRNRQVKTARPRQVSLSRGRRWWPKFLTALRKSPNVTQACRVAGVSRQHVYNVRRDVPEFADRWDVAIRDGWHALEDYAVDLARHGWPEPVYFQGQKVGEVTRRSIGLIKQLLQANLPERYGERREVSHHYSGAVTVRLPDNRKGPVQIYPVDDPAPALPAPADMDAAEPVDGDADGTRE